jgi:hypothetical protein
LEKKLPIFNTTKLRKGWKKKKKPPKSKILQGTNGWFTWQLLFTSSSSGHATFAASNGWPYATSGAPKPNANKKVAF